MTELDLVVTDRRRVADWVLALTLQHPAGRELPPWEPGAHVELLLRDGLVRQYSLCSRPADRGSWRIAVLREEAGRGGSAYVHDHLPAGARVRVRGPRNSFALRPAARYLFIAGGVGITPILPMAAAAEEAGADWSLLYGGRSRAAMAFLDELAAYVDRVRVVPQDESGLLDLAPYARAPQPGTLVYCCGPGPLLDAVEARCASWPQGTLNVERFQPHTPSRTEADNAFELVLARSGRTLTVPADASVLETVRAAGVEVLFSCAEGTCGTCETDVLDGTPDHRDSLLTEEEQRAGESMMICVSRCRGDRLVLDL
ncbi:PDR/VanB family oxidoreductase [Streptomyces boninensis]|uniref:PDR/VanB family oxidoreductase n=1 Tax=Streptomyces boninensis TaxID=2039455 RepID=UPI003B224A39